MADAHAGWISDQFQAVFWSTKRAMAEATNEAYGRHGVHAGQQFILGCLWAQDGLTPGQIARQLGLSTPTVTRTATRMEAAGVLRREGDLEDRRLVRLYLTERGHELRDVLNQQMHEVSERALTGLTPGEREILTAQLRRVQENLS